MDALLMSRIQFASTAVYHYLFVPLSIGFGLVLALLVKIGGVSPDGSKELRHHHQHRQGRH